MAESVSIDAESGLFASATAWLGTMLGHLRIRLELAGLESKEALGHYLQIVALLLAALVAAVFGYFFLCFCAVFLIAWAWGGENTWAWVLLGMAVLHLAGAAGLGLWAKSKLATPMFSATLDELKKDQEWLTKKKLP